MSLPGLAVLICAARALRTLTAGWAVVHMSPRDAIEAALDAGKVVIAVYAGDEASTITGRQWTRAERTVELAVQVLLPARLTIALGAVEQTFDTGKADAELVFTTVHRMIERIFSAPGDAWSGLLQTFVLRHPGQIERRPFIAQLEGGAKLAAADWSIPCETDDSPPIGEAPDGAWADLLAAMRADPDLEASADYVSALIAGDPLPSWRLLQAMLGLRAASLAALGLGPLPQGGPGEIPALVEGAIESPTGSGVAYHD